MIFISIRDEPFEIASIKFNEKKYEEFLNEKKLYVQDSILSYHNINAEIEIIRSPTKHCRQKCRFAIGYNNLDLNTTAGTNNMKKLVHLLWDKGGPSVVVENFPLASIEINHIMPVLLEYINKSTVLSFSLTSINYTSTLSKELAITLIYDSVLNTSWEAEAIKIQFELLDKCKGVINALNIIGRSKGLKIIVGKDYLHEELVLSKYNRKLRYIIVDEGFVNPNASVNQKALEWLCNVSSCIIDINRHNQDNGDSMDLLEMYCGNGNHTVALSEYYDHILAVEINPSLVTAAMENFKLNNIQNAHAVICDSEAFAMKILRTKECKLINRISKNKGISTTNSNDDDCELSYNFKVVLVDPPRKGLDSQTCRLITNYEHIIYISCNPESLQRDLTIILKTHKVCRMSLLDQFAYTPHIETALWLQRID